MDPVRKILILTALAMLVGASGCRKSDRNQDTTTLSIEQDMLAAALVKDVIGIVHQLGLQDSITVPGSSGYIPDGCVSNFSFNPATGAFPVTFTIDYGTSSTSCSDNNDRTGKIKAYFDSMYDSLTTVSITFQNYYCNAAWYQGEILLTHNGTNANGNTNFTVRANDLKLRGDSINIAWNVNQNWEWLAGETTSIASDDQFDVTGNSSGYTTKGNWFTSTITDVLELDMGCDYYLSGKATVKPSNLNERFVDYGSGCDNMATVNIVNGTYDVTFPEIQGN